MRAVSLSLPAGSPATTIPQLDPAQRSANRLGRDSTFEERGQGSSVPTRPRVVQPAPNAGVVHKNVWHFDPNISWYGPGFIGHHTACGQLLTRTLIGVAHRTLPCGTLVTFRNPANGRQVTAPVVDRGPYVAGRTWDMTRGLCTALGHCYTGSISWRLGSH